MFNQVLILASLSPTFEFSTYGVDGKETGFWSRLFQRRLKSR